MTVRDVKQRLTEIRKQASADDDERAHALEDDLWRDVLAQIASGDAGDPAWQLAAAALETKRIKFSRRCA